MCILKFETVVGCCFFVFILNWSYVAFGLKEWMSGWNGIKKRECIWLLIPADKPSDGIAIHSILLFLFHRGGGGMDEFDNYAILLHHPHHHQPNMHSRC